MGSVCTDAVVLSRRLTQDSRGQVFTLRVPRDSNPFERFSVSWVFVVAVQNFRLEGCVCRVYEKTPKSFILCRSFDYTLDLSVKKRITLYFSIGKVYHFSMSFLTIHRPNVDPFHFMNEQERLVSRTLWNRLGSVSVLEEKGQPFRVRDYLVHRLFTFSSFWF